MDWSEKEIAIAKQLTEPDVLAFLNKVLTEIHTDNGEVLSKNVVALDDAEYGRLMKVHYLSRKENKAKISLIQKISKMKPAKENSPRPIAPR